MSSSGEEAIRSKDRVGSNYRGRDRGRGNGRGRGRGRGRGGRGSGASTYSDRRDRGVMNEVRQFNSNSTKLEGNENQFTLNEEDEILSKRRERFLKDQEKIERNKETEFGLICRGEDLRLQNDESSRLKLFNILKQDWEIYLTDPRTFSGKLETILMNCRKLREAMLSLPPDDFIINTFLLSTKIGVFAGKYQTYLPSINFLLTKASTLMKPNDLEDIQIYFILHLLHYNNEKEKAFQLFFEYFPDYTIEKAMNAKSKRQQRLYEILAAWSNDDFYKWNQLYHYEKENHTPNAKIMKYGEQRIIQLSTEAIEKSFFILPKEVLTMYTGCSFEELTSGKQGNPKNWSINEESGIVTIRSRK